MTERTEFTAAEKRRECLREIGQRENVYPRLVAAGKLTADRAARQISILRAIAADYETQHQMLFGETP
jgi:hypothetical protein